jgi:hypothetical protein
MYSCHTQFTAGGPRIKAQGMLTVTIFIHLQDADSLKFDAMCDNKPDEHAIVGVVCPCKQLPSHIDSHDSRFIDTVQDDTQTA